MGDKGTVSLVLSTEAFMNISFRSRGKCGVWYCRIKGGKLPKAIEFCTKTSKESEAKKIGYERLNQLIAAEKAGELVERPLLTADTLCRLDVNRATSETTHGAYRTHRIPEYWKAIGLYFKEFYNITVPSMHAYVSFRVGVDPCNPRYSHQTIQKELHTLVRGLKLAADVGYKVNVPYRIPKLKAHPKAANRTAKFYSGEQMIRFVGELMRIDGRGSPAPFALAIFALGTNWRQGEFEGLTRVTFRRSELCKDDRWRVMSWPEGVRKNKREGMQIVPTLVAQLVPHLPPAGSNYRGAWQRAAKRAGLPTAPTLRCLRHTFATAAARCGDEHGLALAMDHAQTVRSRYQHGHVERMVRVAEALMADYGILFGWTTG